MATTITIKERTKSRLDDYKTGRKTFDEILNLLMDLVPLDEISEAHLREHKQRLETFQGRDSGEFAANVRRPKSGLGGKDLRALLGFGPREPGIDRLIRKSREIEGEAFRRAYRRRRTSRAG